MIVVYKQGQNLINEMDFFGTTQPTELPFVDSTLGVVSVSGWRAFSESIKFYIPKNWTHLDDGSGSFVFYDDITSVPLDTELTVFTDISILPLSLPHDTDLDSNEVVKENDIIIGKGFHTMKDLLLCKNTKSLDSLQYIQYSIKSLVDNILATTGSEKDYMGRTPVYSGSAHIDEESEVAGECRIYGPCVIVNSVITDSIVYPGSVIINSRVSNSTVETSYIHNSGVSGSTILDSTAFSAFVDKAEVRSSTLPRLTQINGNYEEKRLR